MSTDEYSTEMELYGVSPGVIAIIMFVVTSVVPCGYVPSGIDVIGYLWAGPFAYSLLWVLFFPTRFHGFALGFLFPELLIVTFPLCILNIAYARWIVRVYQDKSSKYTALVTGLFSILLPTAIVLYVGGLFGYTVVIYPIPLQFILGLIILWRIEGPETISPWSGLRLDLSWWKWRRSKLKDDWDPFEKEKLQAYQDAKVESDQSVEG